MTGGGSTSATGTEDTAGASDAADGSVAEVGVEGRIGGARTLAGGSRRIMQVLGLAYGGYYIATAILGIQSPQAHRGVFVGGAAALIFLLYPLRKGRGGASIPWYDVVLALMSIGAAGYYVVNFAAMVDRAGRPITADLVVGAVMILLSLEVTRRTAGLTLTVIGLVAVVYPFVGPWMPGLFFNRQYSVGRFLGVQFMGFEGVFGLVANIFATFVLLFILFGAVLQRSGASQFFIDLPFAIAGKYRGGPAKAAILVSAVMGSISGSAVANVMTTGVFTIPLMKRVGYRREFAGGVETAASTGGQMLPPVMGAGAFIIAEFTRTPYSTIVLVSIIPALLYFASVYFIVDFEALRKDLKGIASEELERPGEVLRQGWHLLLPIGVIFFLILSNRSPAFAAFWGIVSAVVVGAVPYRGRRMTPRDAADAVWEGAVQSLPVAGVAGTIGVVLGTLGLTGLGLKFSSLVINASGGSLLLALVLVTLASWVLGAGLTATSSYVVVAILAAPALTELGLSLLVAHLIIFWVSQDANLTPPICIAAFAAASISGASAMATGWQSWRLGRGLYYVPLLMAYSPLIGGTAAQVAQTAGTALVGIYMFSAGTSRYLLRPANALETLMLLVGGGLLIAPGWLTNGVGAALLVVVALLQGGLSRLRPRPVAA